MKRLVIPVLSLCLSYAHAESQVRCVSGIYPKLAMFNGEGECGSGAVVPWAGSLWVITYAPHAPRGSDDKLYEISSDLQQTIHQESVGGTPANRMIHRESNQLFIGPYVIDSKKNVRVIPPKKMYGRLTANMRHLTDPANKIYYATMEDGFYEVDVHSLQVKEIYKDGNLQPELAGGLLPGYHGKGAYTGQGRVIYANNGEYSDRARRDPTTPSGALAEWNGKDWKIIRRNQFTDVAGPGGIYGNSNPDADPVWSIGWDSKSLIFKILDGGKWYTYRLPKGSHSYDGAHGWNTEWPRIREIGNGQMLMTMHGTFWDFPKTMTVKNSAGIRPLSNYLKVIGDFCRWGDRIVFGCDDSAKSEFLNKRKAKGSLRGPGQSNSNLWFVEPEKLTQLGPVIGRGCLWQDENLKRNEVSDPYLFDGYDQKVLQVAHANQKPLDFTIEVDRLGNGLWKPLCDFTALPNQVTMKDLSGEKGTWIRLRAKDAASQVCVSLQYSNEDHRSDAPAAIFNGIARADAESAWGGIVYCRGAGLKTLALAASKSENGKVSDIGFYQLTEDLELVKVDDPNGVKYTKDYYGMKGKGLSIDAASALLVDDRNNHWRFPKASSEDKGKSIFGTSRLCREICTERDMLNICGTFYELPAENAGGIAKVRAIASPKFQIEDYCSWRGLLVLTGIVPETPAGNHIIRSADGKAALWVGAVDDLWSAGKPGGIGGPWRKTQVQAGTPSDPYLMTGFDRKLLTLSQTGAANVSLTLEIDLTGTGLWQKVKTYRVDDGKIVKDDLSKLRGYWLRFRSDKACEATAQLLYK